MFSQVQNGAERVIGFWSKAWSGSEKQYCVTRQQMLACLLAMEAFAYYLHGLADFTLRTDHIALRWLQTFKNPTGQAFRWLERLACFNYTVKHRPGKLHLNADALSRRPCPQCGRDNHGAECLTATCVGVYTISSEVKDGESGPPYRRKRIERKPKDPPPPQLPIRWDCRLEAI